MQHDKPCLSGSLCARELKPCCQACCPPLLLTVLLILPLWLRRFEPRFVSKSGSYDAAPRDGGSRQPGSGASKHTKGWGEGHWCGKVGLSKLTLDVSGTPVHLGTHRAGAGGAGVAHEEPLMGFLCPTA